ncbi:hypothetical protein D0Q02_26690 [Micromonospora craniellae]|uniref:Uncharacterized protein n=1 Tax=Micromonospora craniellae TaxID=2294034 RepID=A0A372FS80_9ACTN|nr:hypothetical protein D0Q02_26690 [Micromonospora craniellae]
MTGMRLVARRPRRRNLQRLCPAGLVVACPSLPLLAQAPAGVATQILAVCGDGTVLPPDDADVTPSTQEAV